MEREAFRMDVEIDNEGGVSLHLGYKKKDEEEEQAPVWVQDAGIYKLID